MDNNIEGTYFFFLLLINLENQDVRKIYHLLLELNYTFTILLEKKYSLCFVLTHNVLHKGYNTLIPSNPRTFPEIMTIGSPVIEKGHKHFLVVWWWPILFSNISK